MTEKLYKPKELKLLGFKKAENTIRFFNSLKHTKGDFHGKPFKLLPWEDKIIRDVYGTLKPNGYRQYKNIWIEIPKKQGKSELLAGLGLKGLCADDEWEAEIYGCAADKGQASIIYDVAVGMLDLLLEDFPEEKLKFKVIESKKRIVYYPTRSFYQVLSSEAFTKHGLNVHQVLFDEIHAQPNRELYDVMTFGSGDARKQPLFWYITTAGYDPERQSLGWELHEYAINILLGNLKDPSWYPVIFGFDIENGRIWKGYDYELVDPKIDGKLKDQWKSRRIWALVNPSLGHTVQEEKLEEAFITASQKPENEKLFKWLRLNIWLKYKSTKWLPQEKWDATAGLLLPEKLKGRECYGGLDLSSKIDISAWVKIFPPITEDPLWYVIFKFWIPENNMKERVEKDHVRYDEWVRQGFIKTTSGSMIDYDVIESDILKERKEFDIKEIGYDPWNAYECAQKLIAGGFKEEQLVEIRQTFKEMSEPMRFIEGLICSELLCHGGNPVARWMFGNVDIMVDNHENIKPIKDKKGKSRIDGIVGMINGMARAKFHKIPQKSIYETRNSFRL
jgi:phage terminase large subunit-like protein